MSEGTGELPRAFVPLLVARLRRPQRSPAELRQHHSLPEQWVAIRRFAEDRGISLEPAQFVTRIKGRRHTLARDPELRDMLTRAREERQALVMDNAFRLVAGMDEDHATALLKDLIRARAPIYSILHGNMLGRLPMDTINANLALHVGRRREHSERIKQGLAVYGDTLAPSAQAVRRAARSRSRTADRQARRLHREIEKARGELPEAERDNRSAIARALNAAGIAGPGGGAWQGTTVRRIEERVARLAADE